MIRPNNPHCFKIVLILLIEIGAIHLYVINVQLGKPSFNKLFTKLKMRWSQSPNCCNPTLALFLALEKGIQYKLGSSLKVLINIPSHLILSKAKSKSKRRFTKKSPRGKSKGATVLNRRFERVTSKLIVSWIRTIYTKLAANAKTWSHLKWALETWLKLF